MSTISTRFSTVTHAVADASETQEQPAQTLGGRLAALYALSQNSNYVFGSPLGPFYHRSQHFHLPRFVYFGPHTHDESLRLAFLSGFDSGDQRGSLALLHFVERLALTPDIGQGLNLSFFPLIDVLGLSAAVGNRDLSAESWARSHESEIGLLQKDARVRGYHGFVRVETGTADDVISIRLRGDGTGPVPASGVELISSEDFEPFPVRWEAEIQPAKPSDGPLTLTDDLPFRPFELSVQIPSAWPEELYREAVTSVLKRFILRYRSLQAYSQHL